MTMIDWQALLASPGTAPGAIPAADDGGEDVGMNDGTAGGAANGAADAAARAAPPDDALRMVMREHPGGDRGDDRNVCVLIGTVRRERYGPNGKARPATATPLGMRYAPYRIEIEEPGGLAFSMPLSVSARLMETGLFADGARVQISGSVRLEQTYDRAFAVHPDDAGLPTWETRLDVLAVARAPETAPDGSWVKLVGAVDGGPAIRDEVIGPGVRCPIATVRIRCRSAVPSIVPGARAAHALTTLTPADVALDGSVEHAAALLKHGNQVVVEGRLLPRVYQRRRGDPRIQEALAATEEAIRAKGGAPDEVARRIAAARRRMLTGVRMTIGVGYVELVKGRALTDDEVAHVIAAGGGPRRTPGTPPPPPPLPPRAEIEAALDAALLALAGPPAAGAAPGAGAADPEGGAPWMG
jgi:hypothetical protein